MRGPPQHRRGNIQDVTWRSAISISGHPTLQLVMYDKAEPGVNVDTLNIQLNDASGTLWFSNSRSGTQTAISTTAPQIQGGTLQVH